MYVYAAMVMNSVLYNYYTTLALCLQVKVDEE